MKRARRRRFLARRIAGVLGYVQPVSPVEAGTLAEPPGSLPQDMGKVWAAAVAGDPSPDLATHGKTGTSGAGSRSLSTGDPYLEGSDALPAFRRIVRQEQLFPVIWTIDTQDYLMAGNPQDIVRGVVRQDSAGRKQNRDQIVLMHDIHPQDAQALPGIIDHFEHSDRKLVSVNELLTNKYLEP